MEVLKLQNNENIITLVDEEGEEQDFEIIMTLDVEEEEYAILLPIDATDDEDAYVFKIIHEGEEDYMLVAIEDDEEYENVVAAYEAIMEEEIYSNIIDRWTIQRSIYSFYITVKIINF